MVIHTVRAGESIYSIARDYGVDPARMAAENELALTTSLVVGQTLVLQFPDTVHVVGAGQTLTSIAAQYGIDTRTLWRNNFPLLGRTNLREGETLVISYLNDPVGQFEATGYAYPYIDKRILRSTMPYVTYLIPFTYGITQSGNLLPLSDDALLSIAGEYGTESLLHLSTVTEQGTFSNERSSMVLNDVAMQERIAQEVLETIRQKGYSGADVDFEFIFPEERFAYARFISLLRDTLAPEGYSVTVALAPKTSANQQGLLYEGHDYALLGQAADKVFLMTYEWGYTYGPPMAVAPLPNVARVVDYALSEISAKKILMGIPTYGYDWRLPFTEGGDPARSLSSYEAVEIARRRGAAIHFDEAAQSPYFEYRDDGGAAHIVWFEDARSIREKLLLCANRGLRGVGYWNLDRQFPQNWLVLNATFRLP